MNRHVQLCTSVWISSILISYVSSSRVSAGVEIWDSKQASIMIYRPIWPPSKYFPKSLKSAVCSNLFRVAIAVQCNMKELPVYIYKDVLYSILQFSCLVKFVDAGLGVSWKRVNTTNFFKVFQSFLVKSVDAFWYVCVFVCVGKGLTEYKVLKVKSGFWPQTRPCNDNYDDIGEDFDRYYIYNDDTHDNDEVDDIAQASHAWKFTFSSQTLLMQNVSNPSDSGSTHHKILLKIGWRWIPQNISKNTATFGQYFKVNWLGAKLILELETPIWSGY